MDEEDPAEVVDPPPVEEPKKHVTVNDDPEVFTINSDTLEVKRQEKPVRLSSKDEEMTQEDFDRIVKETTDVIQVCEEKVLNQKLNIAKVGFIVMKISESLQDYDNNVRLLSRFLPNGDGWTAQYYVDICESLPSFGDYICALNAEDTAVAGTEGIEKRDLLDIAKKIQDAEHSGGVSLQHYRLLNKHVFTHMRERRHAIEQIRKKVGPWLNLLNSLTTHMDDLKDRLYKLYVYLDILKSGEKKIKLAPEIFFEGNQAGRGNIRQT